MHTFIRIYVLFYERESEREIEKNKRFISARASKRLAPFHLTRCGWNQINIERTHAGNIVAKREKEIPCITREHGRQNTRHGRQLLEKWGATSASSMLMLAADACACMLHSARDKPMRWGSRAIDSCVSCVRHTCAHFWSIDNQHCSVNRQLNV